MGKQRKNKDFNPQKCPLIHCLNVIGGKWRISIICSIRNGNNRFGMLRREIPEISKQMLANQLRELKEDGLLERTIYAEIPPRVEYGLTEYCESLMPVIKVMQDWGEKAMENSLR